MEPIAQVVETAIASAETHVEAEAKKVEIKAIAFATASAKDAVRAVDSAGQAIRTEFKGLPWDAFIVSRASTKAVAEEFNTLKDDVERSTFVKELEGMVSTIKAATPAFTQAAKEAQEDATFTRGAFSRFVHRVWQAI